MEDEHATAITERLLRLSDDSAQNEKIVNGERERMDDLVRLLQESETKRDHKKPKKKKKMKSKTSGEQLRLTDLTNDHESKEKLFTEKLRRKIAEDLQKVCSPQARRIQFLNSSLLPCFKL